MKKRYWQLSKPWLRVRKFGAKLKRNCRCLKARKLRSLFAKALQDECHIPYARFRVATELSFLGLFKSDYSYTPVGCGAKKRAMAFSGTSYLGVVQVKSRDRLLKLGKGEGKASFVSKQ
jgi:hypothetical protein